MTVAVPDRAHVHSIARPCRRTSRVPCSRARACSARCRSSCRAGRACRDVGRLTIVSAILSPFGSEHASTTECLLVGRRSSCAHARGSWARAAVRAPRSHRCPVPTANTCRPCGARRRGRADRRCSRAASALESRPGRAGSRRCRAVGASAPVAGSSCNVTIASPRDEATQTPRAHPVETRSDRGPWIQSAVHAQPAVAVEARGARQPWSAHRSRGRAGRRRTLSPSVAATRDDVLRRARRRPPLARARPPMGGAAGELDVAEAARALLTAARAPGCRRRARTPSACPLDDVT